MGFDHQRGATWASIIKEAQPGPGIQMKINGRFQAVLVVCWGRMATLSFPFATTVRDVRARFW